MRATFAKRLLGAASVQGTVALGPRRGARIRRLGGPPDETESPSLGRCHARSNGFDLHAGLVVPAGQRDRLERVCRYVLRPPVAWRAAVVRRPTAQGEARTEDTHDQAPGATDADTTAVAPRRARGRLWADLMRRAFGFDVLACPRCGGRLRLIALIDQASVIQQILGHLGLPTEIPASTPARAPPPVPDPTPPRFDDDRPGVDPGR